MVFGEWNMEYQDPQVNSMQASDLAIAVSSAVLGFFYVWKYLSLERSCYIEIYREIGVKFNGYEMGIEFIISLNL